MNVLGFSIKLSLLLAIASKQTLGSPSNDGKGIRNKRVLDLDISLPEDGSIIAIPVRQIPGGINYAVKPGSRPTHIIGKVTDGEIPILSEDGSCNSRTVLVIPREDGTKYVKVVTMYIVNTGKRYGHIVEFLRKQNTYEVITREPLDIDLARQQADDLIDVKFLRPRRLKSVVTNRLFSIKNDVSLHATIGVVRYGQHIVDDEIDGLIDREVTLKTGTRAYIVTIVSRYTNGIVKTVKYKFEYGMNQFYEIWMQTKLNLQTWVNDKMAKSSGVIPYRDLGIENATNE